MGEPIRLYDHLGTLYITHSPSVAAQAIAEGLLFVEPPAHTVPEVPQTPAVPTGRARRRDRHDGGVL